MCRHRCHQLATYVCARAEHLQQTRRPDHAQYHAATCENPRLLMWQYACTILPLYLQLCRQTHSLAIKNVPELRKENKARCGR